MIRGCCYLILLILLFGDDASGNLSIVYMGAKMDDLVSLSDGRTSVVIVEACYL